MNDFFPHIKTEDIPNYLFLFVPQGDSKNIFDHSCIIVLPAQDQARHVGLIINHQTDKTLQEHFPDAAHTPLANIPIHFGGPMDTDSLYFAIFEEHKNSTSAKIFVKFEDALNAFLNNNPCIKVMAFLGSSVWAKDQFMAEYLEQLWLPYTKKSLISNYQWDQSMWKSMFSSISPYHQLIAEAPIDPSLN